jgi:hypothetical protein
VLPNVAQLHNLLRSQGMTVKAIALSVSDERVRQFLSEAEPSVDDAWLRFVRCTSCGSRRTGGRIRHLGPHLGLLARIV